MSLSVWISHDWPLSVYWGSVAEWVSGVGTAGALLLGLSILRRDHRNPERAQIDQIGWWYGFLVPWDYGWILANYSTLPVTVWIEPVNADSEIGGEDPRGTKGPVPSSGQVVPPGETCRFFDYRDVQTAGGSFGMIKRMTVIDNAGRKSEHKFGAGWAPASKRARREASLRKP